MINDRLASVWHSFEELDSRGCETSLRVLQFICQQLNILDGSVVEIVAKLISSSVKSPEIQLKSINLLTSSMPSLASSGDLIVETIVPQIKGFLQWKAGRTAAAVRSAATVCMWSVINHQVLKIDADNIEEYVRIFLPLLEDETVSTR